ncbi:PAS domain S-box protein [Paenibacillus sp. MBLB4367]|uniref:PAS domain S-box protein n=1 Tax=Paenibacillus sp. MBLB4367 TaxID=3384767 RepID=UPI0039080988
MSIKTKTSLYIALIVAAILTVNNTIYYHATKETLFQDFSRKMERVSLQAADLAKQAENGGVSKSEIQGKISGVIGNFPSILGIAAIRPDAYIGQEKKLAENGGATPADQPVLFGSDELLDKKADAAYIREALSTGKQVTEQGKANGQNVIKSFIAILNETPYVVVLICHYDSITNSLNQIIYRQAAISVLLLLIVFLLSLSVAAMFVKPLQRIVTMVGKIAEGDFQTRVPIKGRDELSLLAAHIHRMSEKLESNTKRMQDALEELRSTKEYFESFFNHTSDAIYVTDLQGNVQLVNSAFETLYGWSSGELIGKPLPIVPLGGEEEFARMQQKLLQGGAITGYDTLCQMKNGRLLDVSVTVSPIRDEKGEIVSIAAVSRNITERKRTEELLRRSEKLSVVGQLAAGVAHEIRNPLTTLSGFIQLQRAKKEGNAQHLELMLSELDRINFIVSEFLILAKPQLNRFQLRDLKQIVGDILQLLDSQASLRNIRFVTAIDQDLPPVYCADNQLKQVLVNVMKNGIESMDDGGDIMIEVKKIDPSRVMIRTIDHGCGIPEEHLARLGEPFFTSKETGTGLGIMVSQQIVANHKGNMLIRSELGRGTCVDIVLPIQA